jgi:hypothetical protein
MRQRGGIALRCYPGTDYPVTVAAYVRRHTEPRENLKCVQPILRMSVRVLPRLDRSV